MQISTLFNQDALLLNQLVNVLLNEQSSLVEMDIDVMESLLDEKSVLLQKITQATKARHLALGQAGFEPNEKGMDAWINSSATKDHAVWQTFQQQLARAKELNRLNGQMINQHFRRNQATLNQLQGRPANTTGVYGPNGQTTGAHISRSSLSA